jgi:hypothetical protein
MMADVHVAEDDPAYLYVVQQALKNTAIRLPITPAAIVLGMQWRLAFRWTCCSPTCGFKTANQMV